MIAFTTDCTLLLAASIGVMIADLMPFHTLVAVLFIPLNTEDTVLFTELNTELTLFLIPSTTVLIADLMPFHAVVATDFIAPNTVVTMDFIVFNTVETFVLIAVQTVEMTVLMAFIMVGNNCGNCRKHSGYLGFYLVPCGSDDFLAILPDKLERERNNINSGTDNGANRHNCELNYVFYRFPNSSEEGNDAIPNTLEKGFDVVPYRGPVGAEPSKNYIGHAFDDIEDVGKITGDSIPNGREHFLHARPSLAPISGKESDKDVENPRNNASYCG